MIILIARKYRWLLFFMTAVWAYMLLGCWYINDYYIDDHAYWFESPENIATLNPLRDCKVIGIPVSGKSSFQHARFFSVDQLDATHSSFDPRDIQLASRHATQRVSPHTDCTVQIRDYNGDGYQEVLLSFYTAELFTREHNLHLYSVNGAKVNSYLALRKSNHGRIREYPLSDGTIAFASEKMMYRRQAYRWADGKYRLTSMTLPGERLPLLLKLFYVDPQAYLLYLLFGFAPALLWLSHIHEKITTETSLSRLIGTLILCIVISLCLSSIIRYVFEPDHINQHFTAQLLFAITPVLMQTAYTLFAVLRVLFSKRSKATALTEI